jgi:hypothetical protein
MIIALSMVSCGGYGSTKSSSSGFGFRAFVSNPLQPSAAGNLPVLSIVDAAKDSYTGLSVGLEGSSSFPGLMTVTPNLKDTLIFSSTGNTIAVVDNASEALAQGTSAGLPAIPLLGPTESMLPYIDSQTLFVAVPSAAVNDQTQGAVEVLRFLSGSTSPAAVIPVASAHFLVQSHDGNRVIVFSDNPQSNPVSPSQCATEHCITLISPGLLGTTTDPRTPIDSTNFDHPVWGVFSGDDSTLYVLNCGPQCGGAAASISIVDMTQNPPVVTAPNILGVPAATHGILIGTTLYVAGTPPGAACPSGSTAPQCGELTTIDTGTMAVTSTTPITPGYHDRMELGANGQIFIGARSTCTNCLSIFNTSDGTAVMPPGNGDVTGIQPITDRSVVYVCEHGKLWIYDTTTDQLQTVQTVIVGQAIDVKLVDPPGNFN